MPDLAGSVLATLLVASLYVLVPVVVLALAISLGLRLAHSGRGTKPEDVLRMRFARGELSEAEFRQALTALQH
jgi:uncharacterized membrane protein